MRWCLIKNPETKISKIGGNKYACNDVVVGVSPSGSRRTGYARL